MVGAGGTRTYVHQHVSRPLYHCATDAATVTKSEKTAALLQHPDMLSFVYESPQEAKVEKMRKIATLLQNPDMLSFVWFSPGS